MITARIDKELNGVWLLIKHDDSDEDGAFPLTEDEILPVMEACREYLKIHQKE